MTQYNIVRDRERPGIPPTSCWSAMEMDESHSVVALVGIWPILQAFAKRVTSYGMKVPLYQFTFPSELSTPPLGVFFAGLWPTATADAVVQALAGDTPAEWAKNYRRIRHDPDRNPRVPNRDDLAKQLAQLYLVEVQRALGGAL